MYMIMIFVNTTELWSKLQKPYKEYVHQNIIKIVILLLLSNQLKTQAAKLRSFLNKCFTVQYTCELLHKCTVT